MPDQNLIDFARNAKAQGMSDDSVKASLRAVGWGEDKIAEALAFVQGSQQQSAGAVPVPRTAGPSAISSFEKFNSPYAIVLAAALVAVLIVYSNVLLSDIGNSATLSTQLIINAFVTVPFILLSFLVHFSFENEGSKVSILAKPFHIASAWLILRLLLNVSQYIMTQSAGLGIYIVLGLIIVVLTAVVLGVQKFIIKK